MSVTTTSLLRLTAAVQLEAAGAKSPRVEILAYSGSIMSVNPHGPLIVDLSAMTLPLSVPLLCDHENAVRASVGHVTPVVEGGALWARGVIITGTAAADTALTLARGGFQFSASIGAEIITSRRVKAGEEVAVNGRVIVVPSGGCLLVTASKLLEISIVPIGADSAAAVSIAAKGSSPMNFTEWLASLKLDPAALTPEQKSELEKAHNFLYPAEPPTAAAAAASGSPTLRAERIGRLCVGHPGIEAKALAEGWSDAQTQGVVLETIRASRPTPNYIQSGTRRQPASDPDTLAGALLLHLGRESVGEKHLGAGAMQQGRDLRARTMLDICARALTLEGRAVPHTNDQVIRAAFSTTSMPVALGNAASKILLDQYMQSPHTWEAFARKINVADFKENSAVRPSFLGSFSEVGAGGEIKSGSVNESYFTFRIGTFAEMFTITRQSIINDDLGAFDQLAGALGRAGARALADNIYTTLLANASRHFHASHSNLLTGAGSALSANGALAAAILAMMQVVDANGACLDIRPKTLVVPPELAQVAKGLLESDFVARSTATDTMQPTGNTLRGVLDLVIEPRLSNSTFNGYSTTAWYLFASPQDTPLVVAFLNGVEAPVVEMADSDFSTLGSQWRAYHDFGSKLGDYRAAVKNAGA